MDLLVLKFNTETELAKIATAEEELSKLQVLAGTTSLLLLPKGTLLGSQEGETIARRRDFLIKLIEDSHTKISNYDVERRKCEGLVKLMEKNNADENKQEHVHGQAHRQSDAAPADVRSASSPTSPAIVKPEEPPAKSVRESR